MKNYIKSAAVLIAILSIFSSCAARDTKDTNIEADDTVLSIDDSTTNSVVSATQENTDETAASDEATESTSNPDSFG